MGLFMLLIMIFNISNKTGLLLEMELLALDCPYGGVLSWLMTDASIGCQTTSAKEY